MNVFVTGGVGHAGAYIVRCLLDAGHTVVCADVRPPAEGLPAIGEVGQALTHVIVDVTDYGQVLAAMTGAEAIIHMAAIPNPVQRPEHEVFRINMTTNWNVLQAAEVHGVPKVVMASSINAVGASFAPAVPREYFPIDERLPTKAADAYAQSKWLGEEMAEAFVRRRPVQIASMRFHGLWTRERQAAWNADPARRVDGERQARNFWSWTDVGEAADSCLRALEADWPGHEAFFINADDTVLDEPTEHLLARWYPDAERTRLLPGCASPISNEKAKRVLGWRPQATWRDA